MKHTLSSLLLCAVMFSASGHVFDPISRISMTSASAPWLARTEQSPAEYRSMIIEINDESALDDLEAQGTIVLYRRGNLLLACVPLGEEDNIDEVHSVRRASLSRKASISLDKALPATNADKAISGEGLPCGFSGKGVTVGFSDIGFDAGHAAFKGQVSYIAHVDDFTATITRATTPEEISAYTTDSHYEFHATHVGGILSGNDPGSPYLGVARGAKLAAVTSELLDVGILAGVEEIIAHSKEIGHPAVINLSLGSCLGPHDGTDLFCRYLDLCAEDAAILLASGNSGDSRMGATHVFTAEVPTMQLVFDSFKWNDLKELVGIADIWASDSSPLSIRLSVIDLQTKQQLSVTDWMTLTRGESDKVEIESDGPVLNHLFEGNIICAGEVNPTNSRTNISLLLSLYDTEFEAGHPWARHLIGLEIKANPGTRVDVTTEGSLGFRNDDTAFSNMGGTAELSVSSLACGHNTICVGSSTTRDITPFIGGTSDDHSGFVQAGTVSRYTSYGTLVDGRSMPHFCAPGAYIVSAYNRYVIESEPDMAAKMAAVSPNDPESYYYAECGTSMATPHAAGIFALWLEADPTLSGPELREIAVSTASPDGADIDDPRSGAGVIDAVAGLRKILGESGQIDRAVDLVEISRNGERLIVKGADTLGGTIEAYTPAGIRVNPDALPAGPVIVRVTTPSGHHTAKLQ